MGLIAGDVQTDHHIQARQLDVIRTLDLLLRGACVYRLEVSATLDCLDRRHQLDGLRRRRRFYWLRLPQRLQQGLQYIGRSFWLGLLAIHDQDIGRGDFIVLHALSSFCANTGATWGASCAPLGPRRLVAGQVKG
ncbi:hypothetical protein A7J71_24790 [Achromobacter insolitus]|nr:hypothetical protein BUW96_22350 [Achromobacter insolitus]OAE63694.1 hypothetical protein A7J71_24790 [Achromobacter insolitus]